MRRLLLGMFVALSLPATAALAEYKAGDDVSFSVSGVNGKTVSAKELEGKVVVMEWTNPGCPFVVKHYESGNMQALHKELAAKEDVFWITVNSSAVGKQGHMCADEVKAQLKEQGAAPDMYVLDASGELGKKFGAKTTPHMYVINPQGKLAYAGAIDDDRSADPAKAKTAKNHVREAVMSLLKGQEVEVASTAPYGCSVKYKN